MFIPRYDVTKLKVGDIIKDGVIVMVIKEPEILKNIYEDNFIKFKYLCLYVDENNDGYYSVGEMDNFTLSLYDTSFSLLKNEE